MRDNRYGEVQVRKNTKNNQLIQAAVICMAAVSLYTTAQGMNEFVFNHKGISYAASAAIQGILLAMSMGLPGYLRSVSRNKWHVLLKYVAYFIIIGLTGVALFCSSWFSYVHIAKKIHGDSWDTDSELLVQQAYRSELYDAKEYAHAYRIYLENSLGEKILNLETMADEFAVNEKLDGTDLEWTAEKTRYENMEELVGRYMVPAIDAMEKAMAEEASPNVREQAARAIEDAKENINSRKETLSTELEKIEVNIENYNSNIDALTRRINNATAGTDVSSLETSLNNTVQLYESETNKRNSYQEEYDLLDTAFSELEGYESYLGLNNSSSAITVKTQLSEMQVEFFKDNPNEQALMEIAETVFESLRNASTNENRDELNYTNLLNQMNQLVLSLKDYSDVKRIEKELEGLIEEFSDLEGKLGAESWREDWNKRLEALKFKMGGMPTYVYVAGDVTEENSLSNSQIEMLSNYDKNEACNNLDDVLRLYVTQHSALYQGIIYLNSPYNELALFSLMLAFFLDIAGFIFGFINQDDEETIYIRKEPIDTRRVVYEREMPTYEKVRTEYDNDTLNVNWSVVPTMNTYRILTGDYQKTDNTYSYQVIRDGLVQEWEVEDNVPYKRGIYVSDDAKQAKGKLVLKDEQPILFKGQGGGPQDGVYTDGVLKFVEGSLRLLKDDGTEKERFLANLYEYVPVYRYCISRGECLTVPAQDLARDNIEIQMAVLALNDKGSRIAAVYVLEI